MEKLVRVKTQSPLMAREYADTRSGEMKKFHYVELLLTDGLDEFVAELTGEQALQAPKFNPDLIYSVSCYLSVRTWTSANGVQMSANRITIRQIKQV